MTRQIWKIKLYGYRESPPCESPPVQASDDTSNDTLCDSPLLDLQTPDPHVHASVDSFNDTLCDDSRVLDLRTLQLYTNQTTPPTTPCVTVPPPATNPQNLRTLTPQLEVRTPIAKAIWGKKKNVCFPPFFFAVLQPFLKTWTSHQDLIQVKTNLLNI